MIGLMESFVQRVCASMVCLALVACEGGKTASPAAAAAPKTAPKTTVAPNAGSLRVKSAAFAHEAPIPKKYTCQGNDVSPPLAWSGAPKGTKAFALVVDDPDAPDPAAPKLTWVHWVLYDIPESASALSEAAGAAPLGARDGKNGWDKAGYGGPCPPIGRHRYFFKLYALDTQLGDRGALTKDALERAMDGHVLAVAQIIGTYQKE